MKLLKNLSWIILPLAMIVYFSACIEEEPARPQVVAGFTYTVTELGTVTFLNTSEKATKYAWDFGDGETSTEINPVKTYVPGTFFVSLKAFNDAGASDILKDTLTIIIKDKVSLPITFDNTNVDYDVTTFNGASFAIVDNPSVSGSNNKAGKVGAITNSGVAFEGIFIDLETPINLATQKRIKMNFRASAPISVLMKLEQGTSGAVEVTAAHGGTGWENLAFDFTSSASYSRLTLFVDGPGTTAGTFQIDDIEQTTTPAPTAPTTPAPTPPARAAGDVISIFSNAYTNITGVDYNPNWGQATVTTTINIAGNATLKYAGLNYQGTDFSGNPQNVSNMQFMHIDYWTANSTALNAFIISTNQIEKAKALSVPTSGNWNSIDIPLSDFSPVNLGAIMQMKFDGNGDIFLDNIYFYKAAGTGPSTAAPTPPTRAAGDVVSIFSNAYTNITGVDYNPNWGQSTVTTTVDIAGNATLKYAGLNYQGTDFSGNAQNVSAMGFLHLDYWTANSTALNVYIISPGPVEKAKALTVPTGGNWTSIDIPLADFSPVNLANIIQFKFDGNGDIFLDNIYFYRNAAPPNTPATPAPTPPVRAASDVISIFSNAYTNITGVDYNPNWGQGTVTTTIDVAGNATLKYANLNYQGTDFSGNAQNVSAMSFLHVDFWTANSTALNFYIISPGPVEKAKVLTVPTNGNWTSVDIPLSDFSPVNLANVIQFKVDGNGDVFFDNLYFYRPAAGGGGTNIAANGNFETGTDSGWLRFQNGGTAVLDNAVNNGGSWSGKLATNGASNPAFKQERIGAGVVKAGDVVRVRFDLTGSVVQPGAVFNVLLFGEGASGASFTHVFNPAPSPTAGWTTFTGTFTIGAGTDVSQGISFLIEAVCGGAVGCSVTANIDNVSVVLNP